MTGSAAVVHRPGWYVARSAGSPRREGHPDPGAVGAGAGVDGARVAELECGSAGREDAEQFQPAAIQEPQGEPAGEGAAPRPAPGQLRPGGRRPTPRPGARSARHRQGGGVRPLPGGALDDAAQVLHARYDKIELPPVRPVVTRVERYLGRCPCCGGVTLGAGPGRDGRGLAVRRLDPGAGPPPGVEGPSVRKRTVAACTRCHQRDPAASRSSWRWADAKKDFEAELEIALSMTRSMVPWRISAASARMG